MRGSTGRPAGTRGVVPWSGWGQQWGSTRHAVGCASSHWQHASRACRQLCDRPVTLSPACTAPALACAAHTSSWQRSRVRRVCVVTTHGVPAWGAADETGTCVCLDTSGVRARGGGSPLCGQACQPPCAGPGVNDAQLLTSWRCLTPAPAQGVVGSRSRRDRPGLAANCKPRRRHRWLLHLSSSVVRHSALPAPPVCSLSTGPLSVQQPAEHQGRGWQGGLAGAAGVRCL